MALLLSSRRLMHFTRMARSAEHLSSYSASGPWSTFSVRQRYTMLLKNQTDPTIADFFYEKFVVAWAGDVPSYNYWWVTTVAMGAAFGILTRHWFFNPDIYGRKQETKKPFPDRFRQFSYSLPYYNHQLRNMVAPYRWAFIDNEPDWADKHPLGYRPNRMQGHKRPPFFVLCAPRYRMEDPLYSSTTYENMCRIYDEVG